MVVIVDALKKTTHRALSDVWPLNLQINLLDCQINDNNGGNNRVKPCLFTFIVSFLAMTTFKLAFDYRKHTLHH